MSTDKKPTKRLYTVAAAIGLALGSMGIAAANPPAEKEVPTVASDQATVLDAETIEVEGVGDEVDGIDYQQEGENEEVGDNGGQAEGLDDVIGGADDATEAAEVESAGDEAVDGIDFLQEGENVGNNGGEAEGLDDVIGGADDANEAATSG